MMQALIAGGMPAAWSQERDRMAAARSDDHYHPNRAGLYEVPLREYQQADFPLQYAGKLIKVMAWGLDHLAVHQYRVVFMRRDFEEMRQSFEAFFGHPSRISGPEEYEARMDRAEAMLRNRRDVLSVTRLDYRDVVHDPCKAFETLQADGWPIEDMQAAAGTIDPVQYRFRRELLTVGI